MNLQTYHFLLSERTTLNSFLAETRPEEVLVRKSFEYRLEQVETELKEYEGRSLESSDARLTFGGRPVSGTRGMSAQFFGNALSNFAKAVHSVGANLKSQELSTSGQVPYEKDYELNITGIARGSFGFRVEEASDQLPLQGQDTDVGVALKKLKAVLEASQDTADDERLAEEIGDTDKRALQSVEDFLRHIADNEATFTLEFRRDEVKYMDYTQIRHSAGRLSQDYIKEYDAKLDGQFLGFFPHNPRAQFRITGADSEFLSAEIGKIITARVERALAESVDLNEILKMDVTIGAHSRRVGSGRPRYTITSCEIDGKHYPSDDTLASDS